MSYFDGDVYSLSQSFRFGPKIAQVANQILRQSLDQPEIPLLGFEPQKSAVFEYQGKVKQRSTLLARTNFRLFEGLVQIKLPFHFIGGIDEMINQVSAGYALFKGIRSEEHTSELQSLMRISYDVLCLKKKKHKLTYN